MLDLRVKRHPELTLHIASPVNVTEACQSEFNFDAAFGAECCSGRGRHGPAEQAASERALHGAEASERLADGGSTFRTANIERA
jgi:hypothetical protein